MPDEFVKSHPDVLIVALCGLLIYLVYLDWKLRKLRNRLRELVREVRRGG